MENNSTCYILLGTLKLMNSQVLFNHGHTGTKSYLNQYLGHLSINSKMFHVFHANHVITIHCVIESQICFMFMCIQYLVEPKVFSILVLLLHTIKVKSKETTRRESDQLEMYLQFHATSGVNRRNMTYSYSSVWRETSFIKYRRPFLIS